MKLTEPGSPKHRSFAAVIATIADSTLTASVPDHPIPLIEPARKELGGPFCRSTTHDRNQ
jgi:hypothetical protein